MKKDQVGSFHHRRTALRDEIQASEHKMRAYAPHILSKSEPDLLTKLRGLFHEAWLSRKTKRQQLAEIARKKDR